MSKKKPVSKKPSKPTVSKVAKSSKPKSKRIVASKPRVKDSVKFWQKFEDDLLDPTPITSSRQTCIIPTTSSQSVKVAVPSAILDFLDEQPSKPSKSWIGKWCKQMQVAGSEVFEYLLEHPLITGIVISVITFTVAMVIVGLLD
jgi:hypothetical protein